MFFATCHKSPERKFQPLREYFGSIRATLSLGRAPAAFGCSRRRSGVVGLTRLRQSAERSGSRRSRRHSSEGTAGTPGRTEACTHAPEERSFRAGEFRCRRPTDRPTTSGPPLRTLCFLNSRSSQRRGATLSRLTLNQLQTSRSCEIREVGL